MACRTVEDDTHFERLDRRATRDALHDAAPSPVRPASPRKPRPVLLTTKREAAAGMRRCPLNGSADLGAGAVHAGLDGHSGLLWPPVSI